MRDPGERGPADAEEERAVLKPNNRTGRGMEVLEGEASPPSICQEERAENMEDGIAKWAEGAWDILIASFLTTI
jgi:hypothetical protein